MRVVVTGGAGFIGSHLCDRLIEADHEVVAIDNLITGDAQNLAHLAGHDRFHYIRHDVSDFIFVSGKVDVIWHLASPASPNPSSPYGYPQLPIQTLKAGALGTHNALGLARVNQAIFLLASTSEVYGDPEQHPQREDYWGHVDPIGPRSMYDEAKRFAEAITMAYHHYHSMDTRIVRIFNTYGPRMRLDDGRVVPNFIRQAIQGEPLTIYGDGQQTRSFCYIDDLLDGLLRLMETDFHEPINIGNPVEMSIEELANLLLRLTESGSGIEYLADRRDRTDPQQRRPDITRAKELLDWEPRIALEDGLRQTMEDFRRRL
ncbi:MAG: GDP-mannose 4,6-dehydratase [Chloroflexi bacterium]|nr:GDP-mannose 4,6-dehydratase [Chloroflexota bacterium]